LTKDERQNTNLGPSTYSPEKLLVLPKAPEWTIA